MVSLLLFMNTYVVLMMLKIQPFRKINSNTENHTEIVDKVFEL